MYNCLTFESTLIDHILSGRPLQITLLKLSLLRFCLNSFEMGCIFENLILPYMSIELTSLHLLLDIQDCPTYKNRLSTLLYNIS
jgi:hypothetical protein